MWLKIWDNLQTLPTFKVASLLWCRVLAWEFVEVLNYWDIPIWWITEAIYSFSRWSWLIKAFLEKIENMAFSCASLPPVVIIFNPKGSFMPISPPRNNSYPMFQNLKTCPWKCHSHHWANCTHNNPFLATLENLRANHRSTTIFHN